MGRALTPVKEAVKYSHRASALPRQLQAGPQGSVRVQSRSSSPPNIETAWSSLERAKESLGEECWRRSEVAGAEVNRNCKASLEKSSRCPYLLSLVLPPAQAVKQQKRGMFLYRRATATPLTTPCQKQRSLPPSGPQKLYPWMWPFPADGQPATCSFLLVASKLRRPPPSHSLLPPPL